MLNSPGKVFSRESIGQLINIDKERSIDVVVTRLRKKIEDNPKIQSIYKRLEVKDMYYGLSKF